MSKPLPVVPDTTFTEREGVSYVGFIASQMGFVWREVSNTDLGIDGYLEIVVNGAPIGLIAVQVKSGPSYIKYPNETRFSFSAEGKHIRYWLSYRLPVIMIVYDPDDERAYWRYIQDYFNEHDELPSENPTIHFSKQALFGKSSKEQLIRIASAPDSTAHAMLSLRASRYRYTQELLTQIEMIELYGKRKWLGEWLPLDTDRERILLHSSLARRGPAWFWFRTVTNRDYITHLKNGLRHPDFNVQNESTLALVAALGRRAVDDLKELLILGNNVLEVVNALDSIPDLISDDRKQILEICWQRFEDYSTSWSREISLKFLSLMAKIGRTEARERIINQYLQNFVPLFKIESPNGFIRPPLLRCAGYLWDKHELPELRRIIEEASELEDLAIVALAQLGEKQDCSLILTYIETSESNMGIGDLDWLSKEVAHLFDVEYLDSLKEMIQGPHNSQVLAHRVLPDLCRRLSEPILIEMLTDPAPDVRSYAAKGLVDIGSAKYLLEYETTLLDDADGGSIIGNAAALTSTGDWDVIDRLLKSSDTRLREGVAEGLRLVKSERASDCLIDLLQSDNIYDTRVHLEAANSLSIIGNEETLSKVLEWLLEHPHENSTNLMASVLIYLDRKLYCPIQWPLKKERDFSILRYSVTRDDYR